MIGGNEKSNAISIQFKTGLIPARNQTRRLLGICPTDKSVGFSFNTSYQFKTIAQLRDEA
ncbi:hypothetical protein A2U01_0044619, partial [Trifolium medium]|nr:hypothetical protein [Trifolium medium]